jgi:hypothetical protein
MKSYKQDKFPELFSSVSILVGCWQGNYARGCGRVVPCRWGAPRRGAAQGPHTRDNSDQGTNPDGHWQPLIQPRTETRER